MISELEVRRRIFHLVCGIVFAGLIEYDVVDVPVVAMMITGLLILSWTIKQHDGKVPVAGWFFEKFDRPKDFKKLPGKGSIFYLFGVLLVLILFDKDISAASVIILALGDSIAPIAGQYGSIKNPFNRKKYIEGSIAGGLVAMIGAMLFVGIWEAAAASFAAMVVEGIGLKLGTNQLDDNIAMPVAAGTVIWALRMIL